VSAVKRGQYNAVTSAMERAVKQYANTSLSLFDMTTDELKLEVVINRVRKVCVVDDANLENDKGTGAIFTVEAFREALAREQAAAEDPDEDDVEPGCRPVKGTSSLKTVSGMHKEGVNKWTATTSRNVKHEVKEALRLVTAVRSHNWALFRPRLSAAPAAKAPQKAATGTSSANLCARPASRPNETSATEVQAKVLSPCFEAKVAATSPKSSAEPEETLLDQEPRMSLEGYMSLMTLAGI